MQNFESRITNGQCARQLAYDLQLEVGPWRFRAPLACGRLPHGTARLAVLPISDCVVPIGQARLPPKTSDNRNMTRNRKKQILAMAAAVPATTQNPSNPATNAIMRNVTA